MEEMGGSFSREMLDALWHHLLICQSGEEWREAGGYITDVREWSVPYEKYLLMLSRCHSMCLNYSTWTLLTCSIPLEEKIHGYKADYRIFLQ